MKKVHILILYCVVLAILGGCKATEEVNNNITDDQAITNNEDNLAEEESEQKVDNQGNIDNDIDDDNNEESSCEDNNDDSYAIKVDRNLTGIELIKAAKVHPASTIAYNITSVFESMDGSYLVNGTMLRDGNNYKKVTEATGAGQEGKIITIHNDEDKMTYQYYESTMTGYMYTDDQSEYGPSTDGDYDLSLLYAQETNLIDAKVIDYQDEPVIYFEILESGNHVDSWVSLKYGIMIKYQVSNDEKVISSVTISNITIPEGIDNSYFEPPDNVSFEDFSN